MRKQVPRDQVEGHICLLFTILQSINRFPTSEIKIIIVFLWMITNFATQFSLLIDFIIAHDYGFSRRPAMMSGVVR